MVDSEELKWAKSLGWSLEEYKDYLEDLNKYEHIRRGQCVDYWSAYEILEGEEGQCDNCYHPEDFPHLTIAEAKEKFDDVKVGHRICMYCLR
tara:strand:+ start:643 stop:918 length:276 start_codon:yes stop_codon:yes gene_type:complete